MQPCVYIRAKRRNGALYCGVTSDLPRLIWQHKQGSGSSHTNLHRIKLLVWYELLDTIEQAIVREKRIKNWKRRWKLRLIEENNPDWCDLYADLNK